MESPQATALSTRADDSYRAGKAVGVLRTYPRSPAGTFVGDEIDFTTNFHLDVHQDIFLGYSKLFAGTFIHRTAGPQSGPSFFYLQYSFKW